MKRRQEESRTQAASGPDLMDDAAFQALYDRSAHQGAHQGLGQGPSESAVQGWEQPSTPPPVPAQTPPPNTLPVVSLRLEDRVEEEPLLLTGELLEEAPPLEPLSFEQAQAALVGVHDRDEIARVVLRAAIGRFRRACLLTVFSTRFVGWEGAGPDCSTPVIRRYQLDAREESVFSLVRQSRAHYIGPLQKYKAHAPWVKLLGRQIPLSVAVFPVLVQGRVVNLIYGDNGHNEHVNPDVAELLLLSQHIARSYEALLDEKRALRGGP